MLRRSPELISDQFEVATEAMEVENVREGALWYEDGFGGRGRDREEGEEKRRGIGIRIGVGECGDDSDSVYLFVFYFLCGGEEVAVSTCVET